MLLWLLACLSGCQVSSPGQHVTRRTPLSVPEDPPAAEQHVAPVAEREPSSEVALASGATVRGQSPYQRQMQSAATSDLYRVPMAATNVSGSWGSLPPKSGATLGSRTALQPPSVSELPTVNNGYQLPSYPAPANSQPYPANPYAGNPYAGAPRAGQPYGSGQYGAGPYPPGQYGAGPAVQPNPVAPGNVQPYAGAPPTVAPNQAAPPNASPYNAAPFTPSSPYNPAPYNPAPYNPAPYNPAPYNATPYGAPPAGVAPPVYGQAPPPGGYYPPGYPPQPYAGAIAPGATAPYNAGVIAPGATGVVPPAVPVVVPPGQPGERIAPIDVYLQERRTGRVMFGGTVNSDLGVAGQVIIEERNFDLWRHSSRDFQTGRAFLGGNQHFRLELMPGTEVHRYALSWSQPNIHTYSPWSLSLGGYYYRRNFDDWDEQRLGGRIAVGRELSSTLAFSAEFRAEDVDISDPRVVGVPELDSALGSSDMYRGRFKLTRDTRDNPFLATRGSLLDLTFDQVFGEYDYSRGTITYGRYFLVKESPGGENKHTLASTIKFGLTGSDTPIFENFYAGGYSSLRGFEFRGASPKVGDVEVGGELMLLGSFEYIFPITADDMWHAVAFVDYGTIEEGTKIESEDFRVSAGLGLRISVPALGPAPLAFDFAGVLNQEDTDETSFFSFYTGFTR